MDENSVTFGWTEIWAQLVVAFEFLKNGIFSLPFQPWGQIQIFIILALLTAAHFGAKWSEPRLEEWVRGRETTRQRLRAMAIVLRRLHLVFFASSAWIVLLIMRTTTWQSRSYLIGAFASIATVWLAISLISRLVKNPLASKALTATVVVLAALQILGLIPVTTAILDAAAVSSGDFRLSLLTIVKTAIILGILLAVAQLVSGFTERRVQALEDISPSMRVLTSKLVRVGLFTLVTILGLQSVGLNLTTLTVFSGAIGLGIGFGLQKVVSNLISGVILLLDKSVKPGDVIEVGNTFGWISKLGGRFVSVVTRDGREYLIPNEDLITNQVINWSHSDPRVRLEVPFGVSYEADPLTVRKLAIEAAGKPKRVLGVPSPVCHLLAYGDSSVDYVLRFWIADPSGGVVNIRSEVLISLWYALKENGISIPYPRRDLEIREPIRVTLDHASGDTDLPQKKKQARTRRKPSPPVAGT